MENDNSKNVNSTCFNIFKWYINSIRQLTNSVWSKGEDTAYKVYSKGNCLYDCLISKTFDICQCIPWDFIHKIKDVPECDIFGRTCFFNGYGNLTKVSNTKDICPYCDDDCESIWFKKTIQKETRLGETPEGYNYVFSTP